VRTERHPLSKPERGWVYAAIGVLFVSVMMATTEPTPLYAFWERSYGFGAIVTSLVFATYAVGVIAALLFAGRDSDVDGRRPVLAACAVIVGSVLAAFDLVALTYLRRHAADTTRDPSR
jgi:MFS family permease